jgi:hypothetical protein
MPQGHLPLPGGDDAVDAGGLVVEEVRDPPLLLQRRRRDLKYSKILPSYVVLSRGHELRKTPDVPENSRRKQYIRNEAIIVLLLGSQHPVGGTDKAGSAAPANGPILCREPVNHNVARLHHKVVAEII